MASLFDHLLARFRPATRPSDRSHAHDVTVEKPVSGFDIFSRTLNLAEAGGVGAAQPTVSAPPETSAGVEAPQSLAVFSARPDVSYWRGRLKIVREDLEQGRSPDAKLDGILDVMGVLAEHNIHDSALAALVLTGDLRAASDAINRLLNTPDWIDVRYYAGPVNKPTQFLWDVVEQDRSVLLINDHLRSTKQGFTVLEKRLFPVLPIMGRYHGCAGKTLASVVLHVVDNSLSPGIGFCTNRSDVFLIPDGVFLNQQGYRTIRAAFRDNPVAWRDRAPVCYWRGGTSGMRTDRKAGWRTLPRVRLCEIGQEHPGLLDCGITHVSQFRDGEAEELQASSLMKAYVPAATFINYKYHVDIDGNTNSWPGLFQKLLTGSPVLKIESPRGYRQWYYDRLKPWENFVPVAADMTDLVEKVEWVRANDDHARQIGMAGKSLADSLDYDGEVGRSVGTIAAAFQHFAHHSAEAGAG